jgi:CelD/BcsL family acetyltransferase involved in cellulose biosynthesis
MVFLLDPLADPRWDALLQAHPNASVFHSVPWLRALQASYGYEPVALTTSPAGESLENALVFCRVESWLTGRRWVSLPFSDHAEPLLGHPSELGPLLAAAEAQQKQQNLRYLELRPMQPVEVDGYTPSRFVFHQLDLSPTIEVLFANLHTDSIQRKIRRAEREGLVYHEGRSSSDIDQFYNLMLRTRRRHGLPPQPKTWFQNLATHFAGDLKIRFASLGDRPLAAILTLRNKKTLVYKYGCSDESEHNRGGMQMVMWRAIQDAKHEGLAALDLGRSDAGNEGLVKYKDRWGASRSTLVYLRKDAMPATGERSAGEGWKLRAAGKVFSRLPDELNSLAGEWFYRHMG